MICILAGNYEEARIWARSQLLANNEWFYPQDESDLIVRTNFHVVVVGTAGQNVPSNYFEKIYRIAQQRGRIGRS
jgi:fructose-1-phosphate kinase PfkB-like protein